MGPQRHTPGKFTNQIQKDFREPCLLILTDPNKDRQPIKEAAYANIPVLAFCDTDSVLKNVDVAIPANNKEKHSIGVLYYLLARTGLEMKGIINLNQPWKIAVGLFFYRDPEVERRQNKINEYEHLTIQQTCPHEYDSTVLDGEYGLSNVNSSLIATI